MSYEQESKMFIIHVCDTGRGIERENLDQLYKRFSKLEQEDDCDSFNQKGLGLGLKICKAIVTQYGGQIEVQSMGLGLGTLLICSMKMELASPDH